MVQSFRVVLRWNPNSWMEPINRNRNAPSLCRVVLRFLYVCVCEFVFLVKTDILTRGIEGGSVGLGVVLGTSPSPSCIGILTKQPLLTETAFFKNIIENHTAIPKTHILKNLIGKKAFRPNGISTRVVVRQIIRQWNWLIP